MKKRISKTITKKTATADTSYSAVLSDAVALLDAARRASARVVNSLMTATYWEIGRRIVEHEQGGKERAEYGKEIIRRLSKDLTQRFGRGFGAAQLAAMRQFHVTFPLPEIFQSLIGKSDILQSAIGNSVVDASPIPIGQSPIGKFTGRSSVKLSRTLERLNQIARAFPLPWTHYVRLLRVRNAHAREFYAREALAGGWSVRQLDRQIGTQFYERTALSRNKESMLLKGEKARPEDAVSAGEEIRNPLLLEFLGLKDEYSESDLEEALIRHLENFLLELGGDFTFVGRQRRLRIDDRWYRVDLVFYHRGLRCLVILDLKLDELTPADIGQMNLYCNYARAHWTRPGENPPVGIILCAKHGEALARYALDGLHNKMLVREYLTALPKDSELAAELARTRDMLERRAELRRLARTPTR